MRARKQVTLLGYFDKGCSLTKLVNAKKAIPKVLG